MDNEAGLNKTFLKNISLLLVVNFLIKPIYILGIDAQVQNTLGENEYGLYFGLFNFCMLFQIILDPGIINYNSQLVSKNNAEVENYFQTIFGSKIILLFLFVSGVLLSSLLMSYPLSFYQYFPGIILILILNSFLLYLRGHFAALGKYAFEGWFSGLDKFLMILILGYFLYIKKEISIHSFIYGQLAALFLCCCLYIYILKGFFRLRVKFSLKETNKLVRKTVPYALVLLLMTLYTRVDGVMLERLLDDDAYSAGLYARSYRLLDAANMIGILFASLMLPMFSKLMKQKEELLGLVDSVTRLLFLICLLVCFICWFYNREIFDLIYVNNTEEHYRVFKYLMLGFFAMGMSNIYGCLFLAGEKLKAVNTLFAVGIVMNISMNLVLIPRYGAFGAVIATLATQFFVFIGQLALAMKAFQVSFSRSTLFGIAILLLSSYFIFSLADTSLNWNWLIELTMISFLIMVLAFLCGFLRYSLVFKR